MSDQVASRAHSIDDHVAYSDAVDTRADDPASSAVLLQARARASASGLAYAGDISPQDAFDLVKAGAARLIDVRTPEERRLQRPAAPRRAAASADRRASLRTAHPLPLWV